MNFSSIRVATSAILALALTSGCEAQPKPQLPPPEATDPVALQLMQGFPPAPEKTVRLANELQFPNARWAFHHMRELGPTAAVWHGPGSPTPLAQAPRDLAPLRFDDGQGRQISLLEWQKGTYTDALVILHRGKIIYERYDAGMKPWQPHALWSSAVLPVIHSSCSRWPWHFPARWPWPRWS